MGSQPCSSRMTVVHNRVVIPGTLKTSPLSGVHNPVKTDVSLGCLFWELPTHREDESTESTVLVFFFSRIVSEGRGYNQRQGQKRADSLPSTHHGRRKRKHGVLLMPVSEIRKGISKAYMILKIFKCYFIYTS